MKLEAVGKVMDEVFKTDGHITPSVFNTDHNLSLLVKSASHLTSAARSNPLVSAVSDVINQPMRSVARSSPPVSTEKQRISHSARSGHSRKRPQRIYTVFPIDGPLCVLCTYFICMLS